MLLKTKHTLAVAALLMGFATSGCTDDEQKTEEPVQPTASTEPAPAPEPAPAENFAPQTVFFAFDDYTLSSDAQGQLQAMADHLKKSQDAVVQVEGHCDERGSIEYNLALGERRAQSVKNYLTQLGIDAARLSTISYGEEKPAADGHDEAAWQKNRRAEFTLTSK
jgi:peptidoglycan-associated lipoprotein